MDFELVNYKMKSWIKTGFVLNFTLIGILICYLLIASGFNIEKLSNLNDILPIAIVIGLLLVLTFILHTLNLRIVETVGMLSIQKEKLILKSNNKTVELSYKDLHKFRVKILGYCGQQVTGGGAPKAGFAGVTSSDGCHQLQGYENKIKLETKRGEKYIYNFYLENKTDSDNVKDFLRKLQSVINLKLNIVR